MHLNIILEYLSDFERFIYSVERSIDLVFFILFGKNSSFSNVLNLNGLQIVNMKLTWF